MSDDDPPNNEEHGYPPNPHTTYVCTTVHSDDSGACGFCDGSLFACSVCGAFEGATTSECPGVPVPISTWDRVYEGGVDYVGGRWVAQGSPHAPAGRAALKVQAIELLTRLGYDSEVVWSAIHRQPAGT